MKVNIVRVSGTDRYSKEWACDSADWYSVLVKIMRVSGTDRYGKECACDSADWYSAVGEGCASVWN
jgi:hypothetical protein